MSRSSPQPVLRLAAPSLDSGTTGALSYTDDLASASGVRHVPPQTPRRRALPALVAFTIHTSQISFERAYSDLLNISHLTLPQIEVMAVYVSLGDLRQSALESTRRLNVSLQADRLVDLFPIDDETRGLSDDL